MRIVGRKKNGATITNCPVMIAIQVESGSVVCAAVERIAKPAIWAPPNIIDTIGNISKSEVSVVRHRLNKPSVLGRSSATKASGEMMINIMTNACRAIRITTTAITANIAPSTNGIARKRSAAPPIPGIDAAATVPATPTAAAPPANVVPPINACKRFPQLVLMPTFIELTTPRSSW